MGLVIAFLIIYMFFGLRIMLIALLLYLLLERRY